MSTPAPRFSSGMLGKALIQVGGPVSVSSGATTAAVTFGTAMPDTSYQVVLEWVSGQTPGFGAYAKTVNNFVAQFTQQTVPAAFNWRAWRIV